MGCPMLIVTDPVTNTIKIDSVPICDDRIIIYTEFWNMKNVKRLADASSYWHNENDVRIYIQLEENGSITVTLYIHIKR